MPFTVHEQFQRFQKHGALFTCDVLALVFAETEPRIQLGVFLAGGRWSELGGADAAVRMAWRGGRATHHVMERVGKQCTLYTPACDTKT